MKAIVSEYFIDPPSLGIEQSQIQLHDARINSEMKKCINDGNAG